MTRRGLGLSQDEQTQSVAQQKSNDLMEVDQIPEKKNIKRKKGVFFSKLQVYELLSYSDLENLSSFGAYYVYA